MKEVDILRYGTRQTVRVLSEDGDELRVHLPTYSNGRRDGYEEFTIKKDEVLPPPLRVCTHCLMAIESREGDQVTRKIYLDNDDESICEWCEEPHDGILYELI
jgi:hypothetical protein